MKHPHQRPPNNITKEGKPNTENVIKVKQLPFTSYDNFNKEEDKPNQSRTAFFRQVYDRPLFIYLMPFFPKQGARKNEHRIQGSFLPGLLFNVLSQSGYKNSAEITAFYYCIKEFRCNPFGFSTSVPSV